MITPSDSPSSPADYASVTESAVNIQAPLQDLAGPAAAAHATAMARQPQSESLISSDPGYGEFDITGGWTGGWPASPDPDD